MAKPSAAGGCTIAEEREELMVSTTGENPNLRTAHFLKPTFTSTGDPPPTPPPIDLKKTHLKFLFRGWKWPQQKWKSWVDQMEPLFRDTWKNVGIHEAILVSTYKFLRDEDLVIELAKRWNLDTNTFVFPWGEATITLEDMMVLGGYSVLGESVLNPPRTNELIKIEKNLSRSRSQVLQSSSHNAYDSSWLNHFMDGDDPLELKHQAFLAIWLSRYVFPSTNDVIRRDVFHIAARLSMEIRIALAPAVLASIYKDLSFLKRSMVTLSNSWSELLACERIVDNHIEVSLVAPLHFVQLWAWERFPTLSRRPNPDKGGKPRSARWNMLRKIKIGDFGVALDSQGKDFQWHPYSVTSRKNCDVRKLYRERAGCEVIESELSMEIQSFVRSLRVSELVGVECIEQYLPHRVAMQFGYDQDIPGDFMRSSITSDPEVAWRNYTSPIRDAEIYIPARLFKADVTKRYFEWWGPLRTAHKHVMSDTRPWEDSGGSKLNGVKYEDFEEDDLEDDEEDKLTISQVYNLRKEECSENGVSQDSDCPPVFKSSASSTLCADGAARKSESMTKSAKPSLKSVSNVGKKQHTENGIARNFDSPAGVNGSEEDGEGTPTIKVEIPEVNSQSYCKKEPRLQYQTAAEGSSPQMKTTKEDTCQRKKRMNPGDSSTNPIDVDSDDESRPTKIENLGLLQRVQKMEKLLGIVDN